MATAVPLSGGCTLHSVTDNQKRWLVFGIALSKVLVPEIRPFVEQGVQSEYRNLQTSHGIHTQSTSGRLKNWPTSLKYENINGNGALPRLPGGRFNHSLFDCRVTSHVDFARLYVKKHMAKFIAFDEHWDASVVLTLLNKVPVFSPAVQSVAGDVRKARNDWAHCVFSDWDPVNYQQSFNKMETLVKALGLPSADDIIAKLLSPSLTPFQQVQTAIILAISKYDESSSMIFARDVDRRDGTGYGQVFQLKNENGFIWENRRVRAEELQFGSVVMYLDYGDFNSCKCTYWLKCATEPQDVTKIQKDLYSSECIYPGISDAFPEARIRPTGLAVDVMPNSSIAVIGMKEARIEDETLYLTTCTDEKCSVKLLSREHLQLSTTSTKLSLRHPSHHLRDCAVLQIVETQRWPTLHTNSIYSAVCVGLLLERRPTVISIKNEPVDIKNAYGEWMKVVGKVLVDTGNEAPTGISRKLVHELGLKPDTSKEVNVSGAGGRKVQCSGTVKTEVKVRYHVFPIEALVDLPTSNVDLLIGKDIIDALFHLNYTFGE